MPKNYLLFYRIPNSSSSGLTGGGDKKYKLNVVIWHRGGGGGQIMRDSQLACSWKEGGSWSVQLVALNKQAYNSIFFDTVSISSSPSSSLHSRSISITWCLSARPTDWFSWPRVGGWLVALVRVILTSRRRWSGRPK